ncbi:hypothetical protein B7463_g12147, partial [Scytalidium lignicola]
MWRLHVNCLSNQAAEPLLPYRTLRTWSPTIVSDGDVALWKGDTYQTTEKQVLAQKLLKALAKLQFFLTRSCSSDDILSMCPLLVDLAGGERVANSVLRGHVANLKHRSKLSAVKLWSELEKHQNNGTRVEDMWGVDSALVLFGPVSSAVDINYVAGAGKNTSVGRWASSLYYDYVRNMKAGLDLAFMDGGPSRLLNAGIIRPSGQDVPCTAQLVVSTRSSRAALSIVSQPPSTPFVAPEVE